MLMRIFSLSQLLIQEVILIWSLFNLFLYTQRLFIKSYFHGSRYTINVESLTTLSKRIVRLLDYLLLIVLIVNN